MKIDSEFLALQLEYSRWASERSLHAARVLTEEELSRDLGNSHGGVFGTLIHMFLSERVWLSRLLGRPRFTFADDGESWTMDTIGPAWTSVAEDYRQWVASLKDPKAILDYVNLAGKPSSLPVWQVILHVVNHATYHRGQITTMIRQLGHTPVATDLHVFYMGRT